jgi:putative NADH-flavin reductase
MKISVLGASGRTGGPLVRLAAAGGHDVTAVVRTAAKAPAGAPVAVADGRDAEAIARAIAGSDAVASCIGPVAADGDHTVMRESVAATLTAMRECGIRRIVLVSASGPFVAGDDPLSRYLAKPILRRVLREGFADLRAAENVIRTGALDWTIMRPPMLKDGPARGHYRRCVEGNVRWHFSIRRADLARATLDAILDPGTIHQTIAVAG